MTAKETPPMDKLMAYLDGEMPPEDVKRFEQLLEQHPEWREQVREMSQIVETSNRLRMRIHSSIWDRYWEEIDSRLQRRIGWLVALAGSVVLILWGFIKVLAFAENDWVRLGIIFVALGLLILFFTILRGRLLEHPKDRYTRIRR